MRLDEMLEKVPIDIRLYMWFIQDRASSRFSRVTRQLLNQQFPNK